MSTIPSRVTTTGGDTQGLTLPMNELFVNKTCTLLLSNYMVYITLISIGTYFMFFLICHCFFELTPSLLKLDSG